MSIIKIFICICNLRLNLNHLKTQALTPLFFCAVIYWSFCSQRLISSIVLYPLIQEVGAGQYGKALGDLFSLAFFICILNF